MRCPHHQHDGRVEVYGEDLDDVSIEVFACCDLFSKRVYDAVSLLIDDFRNRVHDMPTEEPEYVGSGHLPEHAPFRRVDYYGAGFTP